jgi:formate-dependent nitrite reductase membrane component NrfD
MPRSPISPILPIAPIAPPAPGDGRHIDPRLGSLSGEAAGITVRDPDKAFPLAPGIQPTITTVTVTGGDAPADTYYDLPVVKPPPWKGYIPSYFAIGGLAGAASCLAGALELVDTQPRLARRLHAIALAGEAAGGALLIADLGRPSRFHHMLRVFRPTSPMNLGTWILSAAGATSLLSLISPRRPVAVVGIVTGAALSTYTGVLLGNTAIPLWRATRRDLPIWFAALSAASLGSVLELIAPAAPLTRRYAPAGKAAQLASGLALSRTARVAAVDGSLRHGRAAALSRTATWLNLASLALSATAALRPSRRLSAVAATLGLASAALSRFAITAAGRASAADPRDTFIPQRAGA